MYVYIYIYILCTYIYLYILFDWKRAFSNVLQNKIKLIVTFRTTELVLTSRDEFSYSSVWVKEDIVINDIEFEGYKWLFMPNWESPIKMIGHLIIIESIDNIGNDYFTTW